MIPGLENTPPEIALALGFFMAQGLEKSAKQGLIAALLPWVDHNFDGSRSDDE